MPSLRLDQSDLKCKNGCEFYGNPQWQGYCSKCHREQRQRKAEKASASATLPKPEKKQERGIKLSSNSSFSKFEEKRLRQSETLKKANLLKFSVFKKTSSDDHETPEKRQQEFKIPSSVNQNMKIEFRARFPRFSVQVDRESRGFVHSFIMDVIKHAGTMSVDELSERVQRQYQRYMKHMDTASHYANVDADSKEMLIDFVEKHAMTYLYEVPSLVFSPAGTDDERADRTMSERIQQLSWVSEKHLECKIDRNSGECRQLLHRAISELLAMDNAVSPGGKLTRVRQCCKHVLALCGVANSPASADDLLPQLIFTVLKANPPRLISNINFVTRFCNAQRLMTGEGGYYFTNLCCAVSFIENLTAESLNMDKKEFDCLMAMPASIGGSAWAAALSLCAELREADEQRAMAKKLLSDTEELRRQAASLKHNALTFEEEIAKKVKDVLAKTPLEIKPRRELPRFGKCKDLRSAPLIDLGSPSPPATYNPTQEEMTPEHNKNQPSVIQELAIPLQPITVNTDGLEKNTSVLEDLRDQKSPQTWGLKQTNSMELLTPSPLGFTSFDSRSIDELMSPDEFGVDQLAPGLSNINYDIDLSDFSGDNSAADDPPKNKNPFSPEGLNKSFDPFQSLNPADNLNPALEDLNQVNLVDTKSQAESAPFEVHTYRDISSATNTLDSGGDTFSPEANQKTSILDDNDSPVACLLPSPLLPQNSNQIT